MAGYRNVTAQRDSILSKENLLDGFYDWTLVCYVSVLNKEVRWSGKSSGGLELNGLHLKLVRAALGHVSYRCDHTDRGTLLFIVPARSY